MQLPGELEGGFVVDGPQVGDDRARARSEERACQSVPACEHARPAVGARARAERWRTARDMGETLPAAEQSELDALVEAELRAAGDRASETSAPPTPSTSSRRAS